MNENKIKVPIMQLPCDECIDSPSHTASNGEFIATLLPCTGMLALFSSRERHDAEYFGGFFRGISEEAFAAFVIAGECLWPSLKSRLCKKR